MFSNSMCMYCLFIYFCLLILSIDMGSKLPIWNLLYLVEFLALDQVRNASPFLSKVFFIWSLLIPSNLGLKNSHDRVFKFCNYPHYLTFFPPYSSSMSLFAILPLLSFCLAFLSTSVSQAIVSFIAYWWCARYHAIFLTTNLKNFVVFVSGRLTTEVAEGSVGHHQGWYFSGDDSLYISSGRVYSLHSNLQYPNDSQC